MAGSWLKEFVSQRLCTKALLQAGILNIRFVVDETLMVDITSFLTEIGLNVLYH